MAGILQEEYPFSFIGNPSSLQFLASSELVLNLWRFKYFNRPASERNNDTSASWFLENISCSSDEITGLPSCMKKEIDEKIEKIRDRLFLWICYHSSLRVFDGDFRDVFFKCFNSIVLNQHGIIGYKETASNLVKLADFSYDVKYEIACEYCLEDDVKRIWPFVSNELRTADDKYSLIYFWNCRMSSTYDSFKIITRFQRAYKNWEAFEYLFNLLPDEQKISNTVSFLKHTNDKASLRSLRKLNRDLACEVFQLQACRILSTLMKKEEYIWHLLEFWAVVKVPVFEKPTVFFDILNDLWKRVFNGCCSDYVGIDQINCLLIEVWTSAPDELKSFILNRHVDHFFDKLFLSEKKFDYYYGHDVTFLLQLFVNSNYEVRSKLWQKNWRKLVLRAKPWCLEQFMRSVFPNEDTIEDFKRRFMFGFKPILDCFCILGKYPDFNDYLHFLSKNPKIILDLGKRALKSNVGAIVIWLKDTDKARKFNEFVCSIFSNSVEDIANFKEHLISCHRAIEALYSVHYDFCVKEIDVAVDAFSMSGEKLQKMKRKCLDFSRGHLMTDQALYFSRYGWQRWLKWCTANDKEISAFRKSLNIDEILDKQVTNFGKKFELYMKEYEGGLYFFDHFAEWYFPNDEVRKKFKLRKIKNFKKNSAIMDILKSGVRFKISTMVEWFFEDDFDKSREFLSSLYGTRNSRNLTRIKLPVIIGYRLLDMAGILQEEYPFNVMKEPSSLQFLASSELVLNLWRFKYYSRPLTEIHNDTSAFWFLENISCSCDDILVLPSCMKKTINEKIKNIKNQLWSWMDFHSVWQRSLFDDDFRDVFPKCFASILLNHNGSIDYKATASNLVKVTPLNNDEKYRLACMYCLEDDIKRIWPSVSNDVRLMNDKFSLVFYWNCRMSFTSDSIAMSTRFLRTNSSKFWAAFEYFFDLLIDQYKVSSAISFFKNNHYEAALRSLRKLNGDLARDVIQSQACKILSTLVEKEEYRFHLRELWTAMKDLVFEKPTVFLDILDELWKRIFNGFSSNRVGLDQINDLLIEVWTSAPDELKSFILNRHVDKFFDKLILSENKFSLYYGHDMTFLLQLFVNSSYEVRSRLWQQNWRKLVLRAKSRYLESFVRSVFSDEKTIEEFKKRFMLDFKPIFKSLVEQGLFSDLNEYLCFLAEDSKIVQDFGKRALRSNLSAIMILLQNTNKARKFDEFLRNIFSNAADIDKFKEQLISSNRSIENLYKSFNPRRSKKFNVAVNTLITSDQKLIKFKRKCLDFSRQYLISDQPYDFDSGKWQKWLEWCTTNSKGFLAFRNSLNIDEILEKQISNYGRKCDDYYSKFAGGLYFFNQFAEWYFADEQARKKFKLRKIENFKKNCAIMDIIRSGPRKLITGMVYWFFDSDYDNGNEFLSRSGINLDF